MSCALHVHDVYACYAAGPGEYNNVKVLGSGKPGLLCHKDERFKSIKSAVPGPGAYTVRTAALCCSLG